MPKIKTNRSAAKRFRKTGSGKYVFGKSHHSHILTKKSTKRKRNLRKRAVVDALNSISGHQRRLVMLILFSGYTMDGQTVQQISTPFGTHVAGLWQQVPSAAGNQYGIS